MEDKEDGNDDDSVENEVPANDRHQEVMGIDCIEPEKCHIKGFNNEAHKPKMSQWMLLSRVAKT